MDEYLDRQSFELIEGEEAEASAEGSSEVRLNFDQTAPKPNLATIEPIDSEFPLTRKRVGQYFGVSDVAVSKWCKALAEAGANLGERGIDREGFNLIERYHAARDRQVFLEALAAELEAQRSQSALTVSTQSSLILEADFEELYSQVSERYQSLDEREAEIANTLAATSAQLLGEYEAQEFSRTQEMAANLREAKMRGITRAVQELKAEEQAYRLTIDRYRREKEEKAQNFRHRA